MRKSLLTASGNLVLFKKRFLFQILLLGLLFTIGTTQKITAQCIGPYQVFESVNNTMSGWTYSSGFTPQDDGGSQVSRTGSYAFDGSSSTTGDYVETPTIATPLTFSCYLNGDEFDLLVNDGTNGWESLLNPTIRGYYGVTTASANVIAGSPAFLSGFPNWDLVSVTFGGAANNGRSNSNLKFQMVDNVGGMLVDDIAWTSRTASENTIVVSQLGASTTCNPITVPAAGTGFLTYYDQGGSSDNYNKSQTQIMTFAPAIASEKVKITFESPFALNAGGVGVVSTIYVYNGPSTASTLMLTHTSTTSLPGVTVYTSTDATGNITVRFVSGTGAPLSGFKIKVECVGCAAPTALAFAAAGGVSHNSAFLTWSGTAPNYDVYYSTTNTAPTGATSPNGGTVATTSATVSGLSASTLYYFWVRSNCGGSTSTWLGPQSRTTLCTPQTVTYFENFNGLVGGVLPTCTSTTNAATWKSNASNGNLFCNGIGDSFFTQGVTLTAGQMYRVSYDYSSNATGTADMVVEWGRPTNNVAPTQSNISTFLGAHYSIGSTTAISNIVNFTATVTGTHYLEFFLDDLTIPASGQLNIDNVKIEIETCLPPSFAAASPVAPAQSTSPEVTGVNDFGATIAWLTPATGNPSNGYFYFVNTTNTPPGFNDVATGSTGFMVNSVTLAGLSPNTRYYVWVRGNCGGQISTWSPRYVTFVTTNITAPTLIQISDATTPYNVTCGQNITFTDSNYHTTSGAGFAIGDYNDYEKTTTTPYTYTFIPTTAGAKLKVVFNSFRTEDRYDGLLIYSGTSAAGTLMSSGLGAGINAATCPAGSFRGTGSPGTILSTAADGSLTFVFRTDLSIVFAGWTAAITCVTNPPTITSFTPANNSCGSATTVVITGTNFTSVSSVTFNGIAAVTYTVNSATQITATLPAGATTGKIKVTTAEATATSLTDFTVQTAAPAATGVTVCVNGTGNLTSSATCDLGGLTTFSGSLPASSPLAPKPSGSGTFCNFIGGNNYYYTATQITVSLTGTYTFQTTSAPSIDLMGYITSGPFTAGSCATGTYIRGDDDAAGGLQPSITVTLTAGVVYTLFTTTYNAFATTALYTWNVTPPAGGTISLYQAGQVQWFTAASGGSAIGAGTPFNPVGVAGSGLANTNTAGTTVFYAECSSNSGCRTATNFVITPATPGTASSDQNVCSGSAAPLTLVGNAGSVTRWQYCPNASFTPIGTVVDIASSASNTLTSLQIGTFAGTRYFRAQVTIGSCVVYSNVITISFSKTIWNGSWSNGEPNSTTGAEFQADYLSSADTPLLDGNLSACSVLISSAADVVFDIGTLTVQKEVNVSSGFLTIEDNASLYQVQAVANAPGVYSGGNSGSITSRRVAEPMYKFDYTYWSTPVNPQNLLAVSPVSPIGLFLTYNDVTSSWQYIASPSTTTMTVGKGYLIRAPTNYPVSPALPLSFTASFAGVPNNGTFTIPISGGASQMNLLGNPYPSALNATDFINGNTNVNGTLYFWTHNTPINPTTFQYTASDYAVYNLIGGTLPAPTSGAGTSNLTAPLGNIASGQGFFVKGLSNGTATYSNSMRRAGNNTQFYKTNTRHTDDTSLEKHRYWVDIANSQGAFKQILIGYVETATSGLDRLFDGEMVDVGNAITLYSTVEDTKLSIQGRPLPFDIADTVPLGYKSTINGNYTINLSLYDGLFTTQHVYLEDKLLNVIHDLRVSSYSFATLLGTFNDRFVLRYTDTALGTPDPVFTENSVIVYKNDQGLYIDSGAINMATVSIYDIRGRLLATQKQVNRTTTVFNTLPTTNQVLLVRIEAENGVIVTKKVVY